MEKKSKLKKEEHFFKDYDNIMNSDDSFIVPVEWKDNGDSIQKFSLYEDYTPVKTSGDTNLLV